MTFAEKMKAQAIAANKQLVLAEGTELRTIQAARKIVDEKLPRPLSWSETMTQSHRPPIR